MSRNNITTVQLRNSDGIKVITLETMTKEFYHENHEDIYCPNPSCDARILYCSGEKMTPYFRTLGSTVNGEDIIEQHIDDCIYGVEHDKVLAARVKYDPNIQVGLTDEHIKRALKYAYKKQKEKDSDSPRKANKNRKRKKTKSIISQDNGSLVIKGKLSLTADAPTDDVVARETALRHKNINEIDVNDYGLARAVLGEINEIVFETNGYCTIELNMNDSRKGRVYFGEQFKVLNETQFTQLNAYATYFYKYMNREKIYGAFIGEVKEDEYGISIYVSQFRSVSINELTHYQIINTLNQYHF